jgi:hypothetical protein
MKKVLYFSSIALTFLLSSCSESIPYQDEVVEHFRRQMKNPDSFRLDSIKYTPLHLSDNLKISIEMDSSSVDHYKEMESYYSQQVEEYKNVSYMSDLVVGYRKDQKGYKHKIDSTHQHYIQSVEDYNKVLGTDQDTVVLHKYRIYYMSQNSFGAMIKGSATIWAKPNLATFSDGRVIDVWEDKD